MSPTPIGIPFMMGQMRMCGSYHVGRTDNSYGAIERKANRLLENYWRAVVMSKFVGKNYPKPFNDPLTFINKKLDVEQKAEFEVWFGDTQKADIAVTKAFHDGYKASVQWQRDQDIFNALLFPPKDGSDNKGFCISSKANNWYKALAMCVYKHEVLCKGDWSKIADTDSEEG